MKPWLIVLIVAASIPCFGKIGDTMAQLELHYGKGTHFYDTPEDGSQAFVYNFKDYIIEVAVVKGVSIVEGLSHTNASVPLSNAECLGCAQAITGATNWVKVYSTNTVVTTWRSGDFLAERTERIIPASVNLPANFTSTLRIEGKSYREHLQHLKESAEAAEIKSFADKFSTATNVDLKK